MFGSAIAIMEEETVTVTSSKSWTLEGSADWVEADKTEGESGESVVKFTVSTTNETDAAKEVTFNFVSGSEKAPLKIPRFPANELLRSIVYIFSFFPPYFLVYSLGVIP